VRYRLEELEQPFRPDPAMLDRHVAIFLYSFNKSELLQLTLRSLAASERGNAKIVVLLNNCTDDSLAAVTALNQDLFAGSLEIISLPVNIGAPAARNWLLSTEHGQKAEYVAFLDDDVEVPHDWLIKLLTVLRTHPDAGVVGAKILAPGTPKRYQYLYRNISVARDDLLRISLVTPNFNYDCGVYDFIRPTATVMGCCHVFTRAALDAAPWFDIHFSPTQMDDISHDLDLCLRGFKVMYCGLVECVHHQNSGIGRNTAHDLIKLGNVMGNDVKFFYRYLSEAAKLRKMNNLILTPEFPTCETVSN
jgi:GT2 family glycosyltransferase